MFSGRVRLDINFDVSLTSVSPRIKKRGGGELSTLKLPGHIHC